MSAERTTPNSLPSRLGWRDVLAYGLFWSWNLIFLAFMLLGFAPQLLPELLLTVRGGIIPVHYLVLGLILTLVPVISVVLGWTVLRNDPARLFALGYVIEGPLMLLLAFRFFVVRQVTPGVTLIMAVALLGMAAFLWQLLDRRIDNRPPALSLLRLAGLTLMLLVSFYVAAWIAFYAIPLLAEFLRWLGSFFSDLFDNLRNLWTYLFGAKINLLWLPFSVLGFLLLIYTASLFVLAPVAVPWLSYSAWRRAFGRVAGRFGRLPAVGLSLVLAALCFGLFFLTNQQPQQRAFALLAEKPASAAQARKLLEQEEAIRAGLLNAYLAPFRYLSSEGEVVHVSQIYESSLRLSAPVAARVQRLYEGLVSPLLYKPVMIPKPGQDNQALVQEPRRAALLYERFFDQPIAEAEKDEVVSAVRSTYSPEQAETAWQSVDDREVHLDRQEVTLQEHGDWAEVELYEVYSNQTGERQEVVYYFSLPEAAIITGLWLGNSERRDERFVYRVSPRGAAQQAYKNEVRRNVDPALVEQIGPRQYRLRAFPVMPRSVRYEADGRPPELVEGPPLYLWLSYLTLAEGGAWPLPSLAEKRNVYWDADSLRLVNGSPMQAKEEEWLPATVAASTPVVPVEHRAVFSPLGSVAVRPASPEDVPTAPPDLRLAVVIDRSRSLATRAGEVEVALGQLQSLAGEGAAVDAYLTASPYRGEEPSRLPLEELDAGQIMYYGGQNAAALLAQFASLQGDSPYDAVFVVTDGSGYELGASQVEVPIPNAPVWIVHLGGDFPLGYDDETLQAIQASGGGVAGSIEEAFQRMLVARQASPAGSADLLGGYLWTVLPAEGAASGETEPSFAPLAARRLILSEIQRQREALGQVEALNQLHAIAVEHSLVTPYSSMIVLVDAAQLNSLLQLEKAGDRFEREYEPVGETNPVAPALTGVPEPHEWLLLALAGLILAWSVLKKKPLTALVLPRR